MGTYKSHGAYVYRIYDAKTNELLAEGIGRKVAKIMNWSDQYPNNLAQLNKKCPNRRVRYERVEREWVDTIYEVLDKETGQKFIGKYDECAEQIGKWSGKELGYSTIKNYIYQGSRRFKVRKLNNV